MNDTQRRRTLITKMFKTVNCQIRECKQIFEKLMFSKSADEKSLEKNDTSGQLL